jgi:cytoskeletal protein CcmA (bactofilin family)
MVQAARYAEESRVETPMAEVRIKDIDEHEIDTILAEDIDFEGYLTFKKPLMIKGKFKGEIKSTSALYVGEKAYVEATTEADVVSSKGRHRGDILGHSRVELFSTARVDGDITTPDFVVESGCKFNGHCNMSGEAAQKEGPTTAAETIAPTSKNSAEAPKSNIEAPRSSNVALATGHGTLQRSGTEPSRSVAESPRSAEVQRTPGGPQPQPQKPPLPQGGVGGQGSTGGGQK